MAISIFGRAFGGQPTPPQLTPTNLKPVYPAPRGSVDDPNLNDTISRGEIDRFLNDGAALSVASSNIDHVEYDSHTQTLIITFKDGGQYAYGEVPPAEALDFAVAESKGIWFWTNIRIRGSKNGHRKPWRKLR